MEYTNGKKGFLTSKEEEKTILFCTYSHGFRPFYQLNKFISGLNNHYLKIHYLKNNLLTFTSVTERIIQ